MVKSRYIGDGHPTFNRNPYNGYINPYYWVDEFIPYYRETMGVQTLAHMFWDDPASSRDDPMDSQDTIGDRVGSTRTCQW